MPFSFKPKVIAEANSEYSGKVRVVQGWGFKHLSTDVIQHSGGIVDEIWEKAMKNKVKKNMTWLMLGVAGGTVIKLISQKYQPKRIVGIEIDPVIIDLGKKYFDLEKIPNLEIVIADANKYVYQTNEKFDYVLCDLFGSDSPPEFVYEKKFLERLKEIGTKVFVNHIYDTRENKLRATRLIQLIREISGQPVEKQVLKNIVIDY